jgi:hypothetical protein
MENMMIDVNDLNKLDCEKARDDVVTIYNGKDNWHYAGLMRFIDQVEALQRKYTKPIAALLKGPNG